jgi:peptide/nickel transport system permease protein
MMPTDFIDVMMAPRIAGGTVTQGQIDAMRRFYGLNVEHPMDRAYNSFYPYAIGGWERFFSSMRSFINGYWSWLFAVLGGDLGMSFMWQMPVSAVIGEAMWISFSLAIVAMVLQFAIAIPAGIYVSTRQYSAVDNTTTVIILTLMSLPSFFFGNLLIMFFSHRLGWFPMGGTMSGHIQFRNWFHQFGNQLWHLVLPIFTVTLLGVGGTMRFTRITMLEVLSADYIRTARAKGCSEKTAIYKHAFRNTLIPIVTSIAGILPGLFGGMIILEEIFNIPGIGQRALVSLRSGDVPFIMGFNMFLAILSVLGTLLSDLAYVLVDPRIKLDR